MTFFADDQVDFQALRQRAYNLRWAMQPEGVIPLTAADPDFPIAPVIREAIKQYADVGVFSYGPPEGLPEFRTTVVDFLQQRRHFTVAPEQILPTSGAAHGMFLIAQYLLNPGDEAVVFDPVDFLFRASVENAGAVVKLNQIDSRSRVLDVAQLRSLITPRTKLLTLCNPHNPLGRVWTRAELLAFGEIALEYDLQIMADEIWSDIIYPGHEHISIATLSPELAARTWTVVGFSKTFGLAGLRIGYVVAPSVEQSTRLLEISNMQSTAYGVTPISQIAAATAYRQGWDWADQFIDHLTQMRHLTLEYLSDLDGVWCNQPQGTYVAFPNIAGLGRSSSKVADYLLHKHQVAIVPGAARWFGPGAEGHIRICYSTSHAILTQGMERVRAGLQALARDRNA